MEDDDDRSILQVAYDSIGELPNYPSVEELNNSLQLMLDDHIDYLNEFVPNDVRTAKTYDMLLVAALRRSQSNIAGFLAMIEQRNKFCAQSITRLQIDTLMRLHACVVVGDLNAFMLHILKGLPPHKFKIPNGPILTDKEMHTGLSVLYEGMSKHYTDTSGYIHLSADHLSGVFDHQKSRSGKLVFAESDTLTYWDELQVRACMVRFQWITSCVLHYTENVRRALKLGLPMLDTHGNEVASEAEPNSHDLVVE